MLNYSYFDINLLNLKHFIIQYYSCIYVCSEKKKTSFLRNVLQLYLHRSHKHKRRIYSIKQKFVHGNATIYAIYWFFTATMVILLSSLVDNNIVLYLVQL